MLCYGAEVLNQQAVEADPCKLFFDCISVLKCMNLY